MSRALVCHVTHMIVPRQRTRARHTRTLVFSLTQICTHARTYAYAHTFVIWFVFGVFGGS